MRPLSVVQVVGNSVIGGAERHVRDLVRSLCDGGVSVEVVCPRPGPLTTALVDVVHAHLYPAHLHAARAARDAGIPAILNTAHTLVVRAGDVELARSVGAS